MPASPFSIYAKLYYSQSHSQTRKFKILKHIQNTNFSLYSYKYLKLELLHTGIPFKQSNFKD